MQSFVVYGIERKDEDAFCISLEAKNETIYTSKLFLYVTKEAASFYNIGDTYELPFLIVRRLTEQPMAEATA